MECFSKELGDTADKSIFNINSLGVDELMREVKAIATQPVAMGLRRAEAHSARQQQGERFQAFAARARGLVVDCQYILPCPHAPANENVCNIIGCRGVDYSLEVVRDVLLSGIYDQDIKRDVLGDSTLESKTLNELVRFVDNKKAARDASEGGRQATAAAAAYKKGPAQRPQGQNLSSATATLPSGLKPKRLRCRCGAEFYDFVGLSTPRRTRTAENAG